MKKFFAIVVLGMVVLSGIRGHGPLAGIAALGGDRVIASAYQDHRSGVQVTGEGVVVEVLPDDNDGSRHQRFILKLSSGNKLLIAHNINLVPRILPFRTGKRVAFRGLYDGNAEGGVVHWIRGDPRGSHEAGWLRRH